MKAETINGGALWYYNLSKNRHVNVRYIIEMKDPVDGDALRRALDVTMSRYPYLKRKIVATDTAYELEYNDLPIALLKTTRPVTLGGREANWHQFAISYSGNEIYFNNTHAIFDGRGRGPVLHTMMYYYCKFRYNEEVDMPGVYLVDTPIDPGEYYDPFTAAIPAPKVELPAPPAVGGAMNLADMGLVHTSHFQLHHLRLNEKQLMEKCKSSDATPNSAISLLMCRAISKIHPDSDKPIVAGVYCDVRNILNAELSHNCLISILDLDYAPEMRSLPFEDQNTIFRGKMLLASDPSALLREQKETQALLDKLNALPTLKDKLAAAQAALSDTLKAHTFLVSYSGKSTFGSCDKHIAALYPEPGAKDMGLLIEVTAADGWFFLTFIQEWREDVYFNGFIKEVIDAGLDFDLLYSSRFEGPKFSLE